MEQKADRYNEGKVRFSLVPVRAHRAWAEVLTFGAKKYSDDNWRKGLKYRGVLDSLERHLVAFKDGENLDPESRLSHLAHIMCNAGFLIEYLESHPELDDRFKTEKAAAVERATNGDVTSKVEINEPEKKSINYLARHEWEAEMKIRQVKETNGGKLFSLAEMQVEGDRRRYFSKEFMKKYGIGTFEKLQHERPL